ncbi:MAG: discoidin domain-containing protein [bacterium]
MQAVIPNSTFFQIDTRVSQVIGALRINNGSFAGDIPATGTVYVSADGSSFIQVKQWTSTDIVSGILTVNWPPATARYVKLVATSTPAVSSNWFSIGEIVLFSGSAPVLWSLTASDGAGGVSAAQDGNLATRWTSGGAIAPNSSYLIADAHLSYSVSGMMIDDSHFQGDVPQTGDVLTSTDGTNYTLVKQWVAGDIVAGMLDLHWSAVQARYLKVVATSTPAVSSNWFSIGELVIYSAFP